jgi:hypothetical protein
MGKLKKFNELIGSYMTWGQVPAVAIKGERFKKRSRLGQRTPTEKAKVGPIANDRRDESGS